MSRLLLAAVVLGLAVPAAEKAEAATTDGSDRCYTVWVGAVRSPSSNGAETGRRRFLDFSASEILDLRFFVLLPGRRGVENVELKVFTPKGHLYQALHIPVPLEPDGRGFWRSRFRWMTADLPVAGTTIVVSSLYGEWTAEAYLDGATEPCRRARTFTIRP